MTVELRYALWQEGKEVAQATVPSNPSVITPFVPNSICENSLFGALEYTSPSLSPSVSDWILIFMTREETFSSAAFPPIAVR